MPHARGDALEAPHGSGGYSPRSSGLFRAAGGKRFKRRGRRAKHPDFPEIRYLSETKRIREEVPDFDPDQTYTAWQLQLLAEKILLADEKDAHEHPMVLSAPMYRYRLRPEIYTGSGTPDPAINEGMYWRTHPNGRPWASEAVRRATGCGFYDGVQDTEAEEVAPPPPRPAASKAPRPLCSFDGCDRRVANLTLQLCQHHYWMHHTGQELRPIGDTRRYTEQQRDEARESWDTGESHADVGRRLGMSARYARKLRNEGQLKALGEIRFGGVGNFA